MSDPAGGPETVLGLDNVPLALPVAGVGPRALAAFVDYVLVAIFAALLVVGGIALATTLGERAWIALALVVLGFFTLEYGYFAGFEIGLAGQTPGKKALALRVVDASGGRATTRGILVRNCVRSVDLFLGVLVMAADPLSRRLGDRLAGTLVVHEPPAERPLLLRRIPRGWEAKDVAVVESFFRRRPHMETARAHALASRLLEAVRRDDPELLAGIPESAADPERALRTALDVEGA